ncbi:MAG: tRNA (adenosine(37)-N6)-dimethylallyltransferase MiaA, partial [Prolixibacteraceae bacterium]
MAKTLIVITGPTGVGKTSTGIEIARHFGTEIISADSRQIFKEMRIGTAVPKKMELATVKHHFIQTHSIHDNYNASRFEFEALNLLQQLFRKYDVVLMVGGSMLYIDAVCNGIDLMPDVDMEIRCRLKDQIASEGIESLRMQLKKLDPEYYFQVDLKNPNRIVHALEVCLTTGKPYSSFRSNRKKKRPFSILKIGLRRDREKLHERINQRVDKMLEHGLEKEAKTLYKYKELTALNTVGYRELFSSFDNEISREKAIELIKSKKSTVERMQI